MNIEARMARLERQNRTLTWTVVGLLLGLGLVGATAFRQGDDVQQVVRAKRFEVVGSSGSNLGIWDSSQLSLSADDSNRDGWTTVLRADGVVIGSNAPGELRFARLGGQALELASPVGVAVLGSTSAENRRTGTSTRFPVTTLTFFDSGGTVRYQVP